MRTATKLTVGVCFAEEDDDDIDKGRRVSRLLAFKSRQHGVHLTHESNQKFKVISLNILHCYNAKSPFSSLESSLLFVSLDTNLRFFDVYFFFGQTWQIVSFLILKRSFLLKCFYRFQK